VHAAVTGASTASTSNETNGPNAFVSGASTTPAVGMLVVHARLVPPGAKTSCVYGRRCPCAIACGHQPRDHNRIEASAGLFERTLPGSGGRSLGSSNAQKNAATASSAPVCLVGASARADSTRRRRVRTRPGGGDRLAG